MERIAILTDSNSGITPAQAESLGGVFVLPMPFTINEEICYEGVNLDQETFYQKLEQGASISTSQPSPQSVLDFWNRVLKSYDRIIYIPMSSGLSGSCDTASMLARSYDGKILVIDNQRISLSQRQAVLDAISLREQGQTAEQIADHLIRSKLEASIYIMVDTLKYLKKGGRITPAAAALGTVLKIKPVLQIQGEKLDSFAKVRTLKQAKQVMLQQAVKDTEERFGDLAHTKVHVGVAHTQNREEAEKFAEELSAVFPGQEIYIDTLSLSVSCHIGPGALAVCLCKQGPAPIVPKHQQEE